MKNIQGHIVLPCGHGQKARDADFNNMSTSVSEPSTPCRITKVNTRFLNSFIDSFSNKPYYVNIDEFYKCCEKVYLQCIWKAVDFIFM